MTRRTRRPRGPILQLGVFLLLSALLAGYLVVVLGNVSFRSTSDYHAVFADVSGLKADSPVRIAGVDVGTVDAVSIVHGDQVKVDFELDDSIRLSSATRASVRYKNLIGDRYLQLSGGNGAGPSLAAGATIPATRTSPALDLDTLLDGFKPLFTGLDPGQINQLSTEIVHVFQGEGTTVTALLTTVASLTSTLADRDDLIGAVIDNLDTTLHTVSVHSDDLDTLIVQLQQLISGLSADRSTIGDSLANINRLTGTTADLLTLVRPDLAADIAKLGTAAATISDNSDTITSVLNRLPDAYRRLGRLGLYGNFFNFYLCSTNFRVTLPNGTVFYTPENTVKGPGSERCS